MILSINSFMYASLTYLKMREIEEKLCSYQGSVWQVCRLDFSFAYFGVFLL